LGHLHNLPDRCGLSREANKHPAFNPQGNFRFNLFGVKIETSGVNICKNWLGPHASSILLWQKKDAGRRNHLIPFAKA
jgi:hypothetical protein